MSENNQNPMQVKQEDIPENLLTLINKYNKTHTMYKLLEQDMNELGGLLQRYALQIVMEKRGKNQVEKQVTPRKPKKTEKSEK